METAEHREPYESRGSRTDLGAPGGASPPGDSTWAAVRHNARMLQHCLNKQTLCPRDCRPLECHKRKFASACDRAFGACVAASVLAASGASFSDLCATSPTLRGLGDSYGVTTWLITPVRLPRRASSMAGRPRRLVPRAPGHLLRPRRPRARPAAARQQRARIIKLRNVERASPPPASRRR